MRINMRQTKILDGFKVHKTSKRRLISEKKRMIKSNNLEMKERQET